MKILNKIKMSAPSSPEEKTPLLILVFSLLIFSHIVMPPFDLEYFGPFSVWRLFDRANPGPFYDLRVKSRDRLYLVSEGPSEYYSSGRSYFGWFVIQSIGTNSDLPADDPEQKRRAQALVKTLAPLNVEPVVICKIKSDLATHVLLPPEQRRLNCEDIPWKI